MSGDRPMLHLRLGDDDAGHLTFVVHHHGETATFDTCAPATSFRPNARVGPDYNAEGLVGVCSNITREQARVLRDALTAWLDEPSGVSR